jgi:hypothetical protein
VGEMKLSEIPKNEYQERYWMYALSHGKNVKQMENEDEANYPGGCMTGFICWMNKMISEYKKENCIQRIFDQVAFSEWLAGQITFTFQKEKIK